MKLIQTFISFICLTVLSCNYSSKDKKLSTEKPKIIDTKSTVDSMEILYPSLWVYGGPPDPKDHQRQIVDEWYHFRFKIKSSRCTDSPEEGTDKHNKFTDSIMTARLGKDWYQKFEKTVDSLFAVDSMAVAIALADKFILNFDTTTERHNDKYDFYPNLRYTAHATADNNLKVVTVEGYGVVYNAVGSLNYLRATVDMKRKKVISIDKTAYSSW
jgi:hypothetical protein